MKFGVRVLSLLLSFSLLVGCQTATEVKAQGARRSDPSRALLLFSVTQDMGPVGPFGNRQGGHVETVFTLRQIATGEETRFSSQPIGPIAPESLSAFQDVIGRYYVKEMEPGRYEFVTWELVMPGPFGARVWSPKVTPVPLSLELSAREVVYVGNLHCRLIFRETAMAPELQSCVPQILDASDRDLKVIRKTYSHLDEVSVRLLPTGQWLAP
jgi:hypothetical protein